MRHVIGSSVHCACFDSEYLYVECDRIRLKGKLAKRQSIKIDGILKFNIIALHCLPPISDLGQSRTNGVL